MNRYFKWTLMSLLGLSLVFLLGTQQFPKDGRVIDKHSIKTGQYTVTTAGTAVRVDVSAESLLIRAMSTNSGYIYVGDPNVTSSNGFQLGPGQAITVSTYLSRNVYVDSDTNGDKICYFRLN